MSNPVIAAVRRALAQAAQTPRAGDGHGQTTPPTPVPAIPPAPPLDTEAEIDLFLSEIKILSGVGFRLPAPTSPPPPGEGPGVRAALQSLVAEQDVRRAALWATPRLEQLGIATILRGLGVEVLPPGADKHQLAGCDLGITEADYALAETGTIGLLASPQKPRAISLLPRIHLAIIHPAVFRPGLREMFAECQNSPYLVLITGPSRTADIELTVTLGVHGPKSLYAWVLG